MRLSALPRHAMSAILLLGAAVLAGQPRAATLAQIQDRGTIRVAVANEIPYGYIDLDGQARGVGPDVARVVLEQMGIKDIKWEAAAFSALIPGLRARRFDMVAAEMAILPQRCKQVAFSEPNSSYGEGLLVPKGNPANIHSLEHFASSEDKIAIMAGADQLEILQALNIPHTRMVTLASNADAISTVATGRAAAYAATAATVHQLASRSKKVEAAQPFEDPVVHGQPVRSWGAYTFHPQDTELIAAFDAALARFKQTPQWQEILQRYGFTDQDVASAGQRKREQLCAG